MSENTEGWNWFEQNQDIHKGEVKNLAEQQKYLDRLFYDVFSGEDGEKALAVIESFTVNRSTMTRGGNDGLAIAMGMSFREGENNLFRYIKNHIKNGAKLDEQ